MSERKLLADAVKEWNTQQHKAQVKSIVQIATEKWHQAQRMKTTLGILGNRKNLTQRIRKGVYGNFHWYSAVRSVSTFGWVVGRYPHSSDMLEHDTQIEYEYALYVHHWCFVLAKWFDDAPKYVRDIESLLP